MLAQWCLSRDRGVVRLRTASVPEISFPTERVVSSLRKRFRRVRVYDEDRTARDVAIEEIERKRRFLMSISLILTLDGWFTYFRKPISEREIQREIDRLIEGGKRG